MSMSSLFRCVMRCLSTFFLGYTLTHFKGFYCFCASIQLADGRLEIKVTVDQQQKKQAEEGMKSCLSQLNLPPLGLCSGHRILLTQIFTFGAQQQRSENFSQKCTNFPVYFNKIKTWKSMKSQPQRPANRRASSPMSRMPPNSSAAQRDEEEAIECPRRPNKLVKSPPSGRPSVTFSLVLEQEMGTGSPQQESSLSSAAEAADKKCEGREKKCTKGKAAAPGNSSWSSPIFYADNGGGGGEGGEPLVLLLGFCLPVPLMDCARFVGWLATVPMVFSLLMLPLAPASLFELVPELLLLCTQLLCVLALFFGLQHRQPAYLRPFLLFGLFWSLVLLLLLLFSLIELLVARRRFCTHIWLTVQELLHGEQPRTGADDQQQQMGMELEALAAHFVAQQLYREDQQHQGEDGETTNVPLLPSSTFAPSIVVGEEYQQQSPPGCWLSWLLCASLALAILVDGWLLNIVLLAYLHLKAEQRETLAKVKRRRHQGQRQWPQSCPEEVADESADGSSQRQALLASSPADGNKTAEYGLMQQQWQQRSSNNANEKGVENGGFHRQEEQQQQH